MAKALVYYIFHEPVFMEKALSEACRLGNNTACDDLKKDKKSTRIRFWYFYN